MIPAIEGVARVTLTGKPGLRVTDQLTKQLQAGGQLTEQRDKSPERLATL